MPASQKGSSTGGKDPASKAVDGDRNSKYGGGSCSHTYTQERPAFKIDMQGSVPVNEVSHHNILLSNKGQFRVRKAQSAKLISPKSIQSDAI